MLLGIHYRKNKMKETESSLVSDENTYELGILDDSIELWIEDILLWNNSYFNKIFNQKIIRICIQKNCIWH